MSLDEEIPRRCGGKLVKSMTVAAGLLAILLTGCAPGPGSATGTIQIVNVTPSSGLIDGTDYSFDVQVTYSLSDAGQAELAVGFNNGSSVNSYIMINGAKVVVNEGTGQHTFTVTATAKDWSASGDFQAYVNIAEYPRGSIYSPLDSDRTVLTF
jgi:hypothetical protein